MVRKASAVWTGDLKGGSGSLSSTSGVLHDTPYSFHTRFEEEPGTNPEELIAAAHAGCFSMAFSAALGNAGFVPEKISTTAAVTLEPVDGANTVTKSHLTMSARIPGIDQATFQQIADGAKAKCPISRLLNLAITLDATLEG